VLGYIVYIYVFDLEPFLCLHVRLIRALNYYLTWLAVWRSEKCRELQAVLEECRPPGYQYFEVDSGRRSDAAISCGPVCWCQLGLYGWWSAGWDYQFGFAVPGFI